MSHKASVTSHKASATKHKASATKHKEHRDKITAAYLADEPELIRSFSDYIQPDPDELASVTATSVRLIENIRANPDFNKGFDAFMAEYSLDSMEGIRLMTLAEALARIPDEDTKEALIRSKLTGADWSKHVGKSLSRFVNSSTRALLFTSSVLESDEIPFLSDVIRRVGEPAIRMAIELGMGIFSDHFVLGETLEDAKTKIMKEARYYRHSFDMLGEAALTKQDADRFFASYKDAIEFAAEFRDSAVSIKLSALHPRYDATQAERAHNELYPALNELIQLAKDKNVQITIDSEEMDRLDLSLDLFERLITEGAGRGFDQLGLAVQAYAKRGMAVLEYLNALAESCGQRICVRLVKGAYWDTEVKHAQVLGLDDYPVFTLKPHSDIAFLACAKYLIANAHNLYPQFATHNVHTVANLLHWTRGMETTFEFQRLHGMGAPLYDCLAEEHPDVNCCIYAPIGQQRELLPYLIRRLLENSANSSFVNQLASNVDARELSRHPINIAKSETRTIVRPPHLYYPVRDNSRGLNIRFSQHRDELLEQIATFEQKQWSARPDQQTSDAPRDVISPMGPVRQAPVGTVTFADTKTVAASIKAARAAAPAWQATDDSRRIEIINRVAELLETHRGELITLMALEGGKTLDDGIAEVREAVDFCRYYANQMKQFGERHNLPGPNGEVNELYYAPRGVFACISPWNFPVAIFTGQIAAALVTGNTVVAKPAEQTCLVAARVCELMHEAGVPDDALQFLPGDGENAGAPLVAHPDINGVVFTGSVATGHTINRTLAAKDGPIVPLIAETGGQNTMIVDSSALPEQVVQDVITSAFKSAGQRCSALRVMYLQESCADTVLEMLAGAMHELMVGDPRKLNTDIGPVIDEQAKAALDAHIDHLDRTAKFVARTPVNRPEGHWVAPCCYEIDNIKDLDDEHFGPILHVIRYTTDQLPVIFEEIAHTGYGLTLGIHSRNEQMVEYISSNVPAGNIYVNRNMVGAIVGSQPFGGLGLSGTGPKAGGPNYLARFMVEKSRSNNTAAVGGAIDLINQPT